MKGNGFTLAKARSKRHPGQTITDMDYTDDIVLLANTSVQAKSLLHSLEQATGGVGLHIDTDKIELMCFNQRGDISTLNSRSLKLALYIYIYIYTHTYIYIYIYVCVCV